MSGFKDVVGHKNIIKYIQNAVTADAVSHAYILNGERGSGKKLLANLFAMSLQCENRDEDGRRLRQMPFVQAGGERQSAGYYQGDA